MTSAGGSKIRNRQTPKKNVNDEILPKEEEEEEQNQEIGKFRKENIFVEFCSIQLKVVR